MRTNSTSNSENSRSRPAALLWDESFLWGLIAYRALCQSGLAFDLIKSEDIRNGKLKEYSLLFVPGGWASNKIKALGHTGVEEIKRFVHEGGSYLGFCGGAGLATQDGINLLNVKRRPTKERVPSFSGPIGLNVRPHPVWNGVRPGLPLPNDEYSAPRPANSQLIFNAWWPSQFIADQSVSVLATYGTAMPDSFSSDINVGDAEAHGGWEDLERLYQINLDPKRLAGEPAVIEGRYGKGTVLLSLVHFDTPDDKNGAIVLKNIWNYLLDHVAPNPQPRGDADAVTKQASRDDAGPDTAGVQSAVAELINLGERNFLWYWRNPFLLQWRRGVRGLEYCTLYIMVRKIGELIAQQGGNQDIIFGRETGARIREFTDKAKHLLLLERRAMQNGNITYERCDDPKMQAMREELFSRSKSHGGLFKEVADEVDAVLYNILTTKAPFSRGSAFSKRND